MILNKIYSEPEGLFKEVKFKNGVNFIYGKKVDDPTLSINSIGKSTFLDLIDFTLLSSYTKLHNPRLYAAKEIMSGYNVVLEFTIGSERYIIKRSVDTSKEAEFGKINSSLQTYNIEELKLVLCKLIFQLPNYSGAFSARWFRVLIQFYIKIQKFKRDTFVDPIKYIKELSEAELTIYHFYLLGLDATLPYSNFKSLNDLKLIKPAIKEIRSLIKDKYALSDDKKTQNIISKLKLEVKKLQEAIDSFKLSEQYQDAEKDANELTNKIKDFVINNYNDKARLEKYEQYSKETHRLDTAKIKSIYDQLQDGFGIAVKKKLDDAIAFRTSLYESRISFLKDEIGKLNNFIRERDITISELEVQRSKIYRFLSAKDAIKDLTEAYNALNEKKNQLVELESKFRLLNDLVAEQNQIQLTLKKISVDIQQFINKHTNVFENFYELFMDIYNDIYPKHPETPSFSITYTPRSDRRASINVTTPDMYGKGKNIGRTLIYDLFILIHTSRMSISFPRFLIHDGIFDGVDKSQLISVCDYVDHASKSIPLQYIITLNEEGDLTNKFGQADKVENERIEKEAILVLTPTSKLFGQDFNYKEK